ncbi:MAG: helix-turn-helix transcriptional regulator [Chthoniobacterales bacterium]|nr:helix-turn-helix transcriptional regulator [Chthoniobacterales bacterium]
MEGEAFSEKEVWEEVQGEWKLLFGGFDTQGISVEWHDFLALRHLEWGKSFHPESLEICLNFEGRGRFGKGRGIVSANGPQTVFYYTQGKLKGWREANERHCFLTIETSREWLARAIGEFAAQCPREVRAFLEGAERATALPLARPMSPWVRRAAEEMRNPPTALPGIWYPGKILEVLAHVFAPEQLFCERQKQVSRERAEKVKEILARDLEAPPSLKDLAREVGCSPFHLSRLFSEETGTTITRYLRTSRLERAAELLRSGKYNVTEAGMMVGYSSLSHFSKAFTKQFGHCPCVFPLQKKS